MVDLGIICLHPFSASLGTATATLGFSRQLARRGINVHIFSIYEKEGILEPNLYVHNLKMKTFPDFTYNILRKIYSIPQISKKIILNPKFISKNSRMISKSILKIIKELDLKLDIIESEEMHTYEASVNVGDVLKIPSFARIHNLNVEEFADLGLIRRNETQYHKLKEYTKKNLLKMEGIITLTEYGKNYLIKNYDINNENIYNIPIGVNSYIDKKHNSKKSFNVVYSGSFSKNENIDLLLNSVPFIKTKNFFNLCLTGKGEKKTYYKKQCKINNINAKFLWFESNKDYLNFLSESYLGTIPWANVPSRRIGFPMKLLDYISMGLPVVSTDIGSWSSMIKKEKIGIVTEDTSKHFSDGITSLLNSPEETNKMGHRGIHLAKKEYNWEKITKKTIKKYEKSIY